MSNTKRIMEQAQAFASAWSLVGGIFDGGDGMERAEEEKAELQRMVEELETALNEIPSSDNTIDDLSKYVEKLESHFTALEKQEPVFWYRPLRHAGMYEGPLHHNSPEGQFRRDEEPGEWVPLYAGPAPKADHPEPRIHRMRTTDPDCTGCAERDEDQAAEAGDSSQGEQQ